MILARQPVSALTPIDVRPIPGDDAAFAQCVRDAEQEAGGSGLTPEGLQAAIGRTYPAARVRPQEPVAANGGGRVWYAYRDGQFRAGNNRRRARGGGVA